VRFYHGFLLVDISLAGIYKYFNSSHDKNIQKEVK